MKAAHFRRPVPRPYNRRSSFTNSLRYGPGPRDKRSVDFAAKVIPRDLPLDERIRGQISNTRTALVLFA